jgi:putative flippase GtrA
LIGLYGDSRWQVHEPAASFEVAVCHARSRADWSDSRQIRGKMMGSWRDHVVLQFLSFASVGAIGTLAHYAALLALVVLGHIDPVFASACGYLAGGIVNYLLNYRFTFRSHEPHLRTSIEFFAIATIGFGINWALMSLATARMHLHFIVAQVFSTAVVLVWNFIGNRVLTFRNRPS